ncbi:MAG: Asp-tRNA(Asn)/Glu-tRNA(Gln) amidotransferase subunit GatC [Candidatus Planktophila sp.]|jgi:aspartyl-tRNA(Asn)/glutamyl-tRNA(Gln) amidotransferase subunit C
MSTLSRDEVAKLAGLARIEMTEDELVELSSQFGMILDAVARVQEVNLEGVKATSHPQPIENIARPDVVLPSLTPAEALSGAPAQEEQRFRVPQILGEE